MKTRLFILLFLIAQSATSAKSTQQEVDYLELAALMLQDNHLQRAEIALQQVDLTAADINRFRYHYLQGLLAAKLGQHQAAVKALSTANTYEPLSPHMQLVLAQSAFSDNQYERCLQALDDAGLSLHGVAESHHLRAQAHWQLNQKTTALATINAAIDHFPSDQTFLKRKIFYLVALELHSEAAKQGLQYVAKHQVSADDYLAIGLALKNAGNRAQGLRFLESGHLLFPHNEHISKALAAVYVENRHFLSAAAIVHRLAMINSDFIPEAAELYRKAGYKHQALILNGLVKDQHEKLTQRLGLLIELSLFDQAVALQDDLTRTRIIKQDDIKYALAFTHFKLGDYPQAESLLSQITEPRYIEQALQIRDYISQCQNQAWLCH